MQVFNIFFKIAKKHLGQVFIFSGVFLVLIFIMSISQSKALSGDFSAKKIDITILDGDHSMLSQSIQDYLGSRHNLVTLEKTDTESLTDNLFYQQISYVLTIPKGFEAQFLTDTPLKLSHSIRQDNANGFFVNEQLDSYLDSISLYCTGGYSLTDAIAATGQNLEESPKVEAITFQKTGNSGNKTMFYWFQYMSYIFLMIFPLSLVPILVTFQQTDVSSRIACSALPAQARTLQLGLGCICYSILTWLIFTLVAVLFFGPKNVFSQQGQLCILNSFVFTLICVALTLLLSTFGLKDNALDLIANIIGIGMSFLCGIFVPQWYLSTGVLAVAKFLPAYWYIKIINMVTGWSGESYSLANYWKYIGMQCIFLVAIFSVYLVANKQRKKTSLV